ncbi:MAG: nuclear transport factor 2 family protein [Lacibacter sp.]
MKVFFAFSMAMLFVFSANAQTITVPEQLAQQQLDAYNQRNIDAFLIPYSDSVEVYTFPDRLQYKGKAAMRQQYAAMFERLPSLHCRLQNRMVMGNTVIDHELVTFDPAQPQVQAIAIYTIVADKIQKVHFISNRR